MITDETKITNFVICQTIVSAPLCAQFCIFISFNFPALPLSFFQLLFNIKQELHCALSEFPSLNCITRGVLQGTNIISLYSTHLRVSSREIRLPKGCNIPVKFINVTF